jgi:hypothetical protein
MEGRSCSSSISLLWRTIVVSVQSSSLLLTCHLSIATSGEEKDAKTSCALSEFQSWSHHPCLSVLHRAACVSVIMRSRVSTRRREGDELISPVSLPQTDGYEHFASLAVLSVGGLTGLAISSQRESLILYKTEEVVRSILQPSVSLGAPSHKPLSHPTTAHHPPRY